MKYGMPLSDAGMWKRRYTSLSLAVGTGVYANFFAELYLLTFTCLGVALLWALKKKTIPASQMMTWLGGIMITGLTFLGSSALQEEEITFGFFGGLIYAQYFIPVLVYLALFYLAQSRTNYYCFVVAIALVFMICVMSELIPSRQKLPLPTPLIALPYGIAEQVAFLCGISCFLLLLGSITEVSLPKHAYRYILCILLFFCVIGYPVYQYCIRLHEIYAADIYQFEREIGLKPWRLLYAQMPSRRIMFGSEMDLSRPFFGLEGLEDDKILIRVEGTTPPGYLRMFVYRLFSGRYWSIGGGHDGAELNIVEEDSQSAVTYQLNNGPDDNNGKEFFFTCSGDLLSDSLAMPGNWQQVQLISDDVGLDADGRFRSEEWQRSGGYRVVVPDADSEAAYPFPLEPDNSYLAVPEKTLPLLDYTIRKIPNMEKAANNREKLRAIKKYLSSFKYELTRSHGGDNPLEMFLCVKKSGHCELFASATVLLARRLGIPSRYVSGFLCYEQHPSGKYYVSRVSNAHAWAEVFLPEEKRWIIVETTPPGALTQTEHDWSFTEKNVDRLQFGWDKFVAALRRGEIAALITKLLINPVSGMLILIAGIVGGLFQYRHRKVKQKKSPIVLNDRQKLWKQRAQRQIALWEKKGKLTGTASWTMEDYVTQVNCSPAFSLEEKNAAKTFAAEYADGRFNAETH